ncbi:MAG: FlgD immunoglobulin-like domain containing protein [Rhodothermales bacterium]
MTFPRRSLCQPGIVLLLSCVLALPSAAQTIDWAGSAGGTSLDSGAVLAADSSGNMLAMGLFHYTVTLDPGGPDQTTLAGGPNAIYLARYAPDGRLLRAVLAANGSDWLVAGDLAVTQDGETIVVGEFRKTAVFGEGTPGEVQLDTGANTGLFIARFDTSGALLWAKEAGGLNTTGTLLGKTVSVTDDGTIHVSGYLSGAVVLDEGLPTQQVQGNASVHGFMLARYTPTGALAYFSYWPASYTYIPTSMHIDEAGYTYLTGYYLLNDAAGRYSGFIARLNPDGGLRWLKSMSGTALGRGDAISVDGNAYSYVTGFFTGSLTLGSGEAGETTLLSAGDRDIFVAKYNPSGALVRATRHGGTGDDRGAAVVVRPAGDAHYVAGSFTGTASIAGSSYVAHGAQDIFLARFDATSTPIWLEQYGGPLADTPSRMTQDRDGNLYLTGSFFDTLTFPGNGASHTLVSNGLSDAFFVRVTAPGQEIDREPPVCELGYISDLPPYQFDMIFKDFGSGLASLRVSNGTGFHFEIDRGSGEFLALNDIVYLTGESSIQVNVEPVHAVRNLNRFYDARRAIVFEVTDKLGHVTRCDPAGGVITTSAPSPLAQNYPNPFNPTTTIRFDLTDLPGESIRLTVFDVTGRAVRTLARGARAGGVYEVEWDGRDDAGRVMASGVYLYRLDVDGQVFTRTMLLMK